MAHSLEEAMAELSKYRDEDIYVIGGEKIYRMFLPYCHLAHVTYIFQKYQADTWFPDLDKDDAWQLTGVSDEQTYFDVEFEFRRYERVRKS